MVRFEEKDIEQALETVPAAFTIEARNLSRSIDIGDANYAMAPGNGPPFIDFSMQPFKKIGLPPIG
jgi:trimethylamine:corrinoid methyltransferase-like protein